MECPNLTEVTYVGYGLMNSLSVIAATIFAIIYFKDPYLSASPGSLIAFIELSQVLIQLGYFSGLPDLGDFFAEYPSVCMISAVLQVSAVVPSWAYLICANIEILLKLQRSNVNSAGLPHVFYHAFALILFIVNTLILVFYGDLIYDPVFGCTFKVANLIFYLTDGLVFILTGITAILLVLILARLWQIRMYASFLVGHTLWVATVSFLSTFALVMQLLYMKNCPAFYVIILINSSFGFVASIVRFFEPTTRKRILKLLNLQQKDSSYSEAVRKISLNSEIEQVNYNKQLTQIGSMGYCGIFQSMKAKFILDALTSLNLLYTTKLRKLKKNMDFQSSRSSVNDSESCHNSSDDNEFSIWYDAESLEKLFRNGYLETMYQGLHSPDFKLVEYYPFAFEKIRQVEDIKLEDLIDSFHPVDNLNRLNSVIGKKGGRSGSFIYRTFNKSFIVKTITPEEKRVMLNELLLDYTDRITSKSTLLASVLGIFMLQSIGNYTVNLMIMENVAAFGSSPQYKFDLKGSTFNRRNCPQKPKVNVRGTCLYKDLDFLLEVSRLDLERSDRVRFMLALEKDISMLAQHGIMDYSVFGAYYADSEPLVDSRYVYRHKDGRGFYMLGIIDILEKYSSAKICEHW
eukprot:CAMPEP_0204899942 /NCGR_PEP_ID=MMETSP1397-20131031/2152_1 /ASSEMBLY_ACC=CAM_ASM_000891 /TAXON_ID=49980 /ORGANISM="Climacostomum Climacostomum virens, Strain Stock W-24" /LENGTH=629 /DNA_ID=CAMNT_0052067973 /DNA_START=352 /DNA_END=2238 /DNA_ORIENTATION=+